MTTSLKTKIRWLILLPLWAVACVSILAFLLLARIEISKRTRSDVTTTAASLKSFLRESRTHLEMETKLFAEMPYLRQIALTQDVATAQDQVNSYAQFLSDGLILTNGDGRVLGSAGPLKSELKGEVAAMGIGDGKDGKTWSGIVHTPRGLFLAATCPFFASGYFKGAVVCYSAINSHTAEAFTTQMSTEVVFLDGGKVIASSAAVPSFKAVPNSPIYLDIKGTQYVGLYTPISEDLGPSTGFVAFRRVDEIVGPSRAFLLALLTILIPTIVMVLLISNRFARNVIRPLDGVVEAAIILERGDWPESFNVERQDEIGVLQTAFNRMTASVQEHQQKLLAMIDTDPLTDIPNHRRFKEVIGTEIAHAHARSISLSLVVLDIDLFSNFNRARGLLAGDEILKATALLLRKMAPEGASISRYGGEEFAILLRGHSLAQANEFANGIRKAFEADNTGQSQPSETPKIAPPDQDPQSTAQNSQEPTAQPPSVHGSQFTVHPKTQSTIQNSQKALTLSGGCAQFNVGTDRPESLCLAAELALAKAKQLGRNQICDFESVGGEGSNPYELNRFILDGTLATIQALAAAVDAKDTYTKGHSQRVAEYAADLCRFIGGSEEEIELIFRTGTLHDVGKIGVPDSVLKKEGPLTPEERAIMETHPALGEVIVKKVPQLADTLPGVRHHHERWDGKGYPDGVAGENIPRIARVLALADTYDAMTSDRPYRKGLPLSVALAEISKNAGIQFDPELAPAFVRMMSGEVKLRIAA